MDSTLFLVTGQAPTALAWVLAIADGDEPTILDSGERQGTIDYRVIDEVLVAAISQANHITAESGNLVCLHVFDNAFRRRLLAAGSQFGLVEVMARSGLQLESPIYKHLRERCLDTIAPYLHKNIIENKPAQRVVSAASDGSYHRRYGGGAYGWITSDGTFGNGRADVSSALEAELVGIMHLLRALPKHETAHIFIDSRNALRLLDGTTKPSTAKAFGLLHRIQQQRTRLDCTFSWVKGHAGHPLNDAADRLARLARQTKTFHTPAAKSNDIAEWIVQEAVKAA